LVGFDRYPSGSWLRSEPELVRRHGPPSRIWASTPSLVGSALHTSLLLGDDASFSSRLRTASAPDVGVPVPHDRQLVVADPVRVFEGLDSAAGRELADGP